VFGGGCVIGGVVGKSDGRFHDVRAISAVVIVTVAVRDSFGGSCEVGGTFPHAFAQFLVAQQQRQLVAQRGRVTFGFEMASMSLTILGSLSMTRILALDMLQG
jgi:hypothetical protein